VSVDTGVEDYNLAPKRTGMRRPDMYITGLENVSKEARVGSYIGQ
jgi:hypothetical protein